ncbi:VrrA protein product [Bacillus pseudomycoides]|uniref:VrrA/YqfQ family protein n=1 Tax=Bacillus TaxID=1386 RepID=UPI0001A1914B|nr:VrrA/YqfQ family protein [Bacillus pseudomycoides]EEM15318.1 VrrA protein product [Bacillus pseudomycoides DSM 12442]MED1595212.1 VrrA/YqfQ family protein [Bacillus pseudomycoides]MED4709480.1 VrrA/YqfQ family protein [Bacillus pseudomycoides]OOR53652.1 VrrA protein product [Bacillus pseudomycoides]PDY00997.1 VrrA protein product [Bacillus pseudomycoides]
MYPNSPMGQMYTGQQPYTPYPIPNLPPMMQKKKGFLSKLFKKHDPTQPFMQMVPPYRQMEGQPMMHQHQQPYMQQSQQMMPPQMNNPNEIRSSAPIIPSASGGGGIGSFFSNLISNPTGMLNNIEKVAQVAQSVGPVVEQYGPIVRSIPSIVKILTSGKGAAEESAEEVEVITTPPPPSKKKKKKKIILEPVIERALPKEENIPRMAPKPKLYV